MKPPRPVRAASGSETSGSGAASADLGRLVVHLDAAEPDASLTIAAAVVAQWVRTRSAEGGRLRLHGLVIPDALNLVDLRAPDLSLTFEQVTVNAALSLDRSVLDALEIIDCRLLRAGLDDSAIRSVGVTGSRIGGRLSINGLRADRLTVEKTHIRGVLSLRGAHVARDLTLAHSRIGAGKVALQADGLEVGQGLHLGSGTRLDGLTDLDAVRIRDLIVDRDAVLGRLCLRRARLGVMTLRPGSRIEAGLSAVNLEVEDEMRLGGALCADAPGLALEIRETRLGGDMRFEETFLADGGVRLSGVAVRGHVLMAGETRARLGPALDVSRLSCARLGLEFHRTQGAVSLRQTVCSGLVATGRHEGAPVAPLHLGVACSGRAVIGGAGTHITGALSLIGMTCEELDLGGLDIIAHDDGPWRGVALAARHLKAGAATRIGRDDAETRFHGLVALDHAEMGDTVRFRNTAIAGATTAIDGAGTKTALSMRHARCSGDLDLGGLAADSRLELSGFDCAGDLKLGGLALSANEPSRIDLAKGRVGGALVARGLCLEGRWSISAESLQTARLDDDGGAAWGDAHVRTIGMQYGELADLQGPGAASRGVTRRLAWLDANARADRAQGLGFSPQPYRALIAALTRAGLNEDAKRVETTVLRRQRQWGGAAPLRRLGSALLDLVSGYGHSPARATLALAVYFLIGWAGVTLADHSGAFETSPFIDGLVLEANRALEPAGCPWLEPPLYALDLIVPLTTLGTESFCTVRATHGPWIWAMVAYRLFGWILISIAVLTYSGILRQNNS